MTNTLYHGDNLHVLPQPRRYAQWGTIVTVVYLFGMIAYFAVMQGAIREMEPNGFGDLLAGTFAPLAFLGLVLGFFQQGDELRHSSHALWLQSQELANSVEQQRQLVEVTREELLLQSEVMKAQRDELSRSSMPVLQMTVYHTYNRAGFTEVGLRLANFGEPASNVIVHSPDDEGDFLLERPVLGTGEYMSIELKVSPVLLSETFKVTYLDARHLRRTALFELQREDGIEPPEFCIWRVDESLSDS